jgi:photosynthetic reaction center cytochrome c subunit
MSFTLKIVIAFAALIAVGLALTLEVPPVETIQRGFRGTAMVENYDPRAVKAVYAQNQLPDEIPAIPPAGQLSSAVYQNVQVLKDVDANEFLRLMSAITAWVSPQQGCNYCHNPENMASDAIYTKVVARRMIQMAQHINTNWKTHVATTGVTCYTCHRGNPVPANVWFTQPDQSRFSGMVESNVGKNHPAPAINDSSLPGDPFTPFLLNDSTIRVESTTALPTGDRQSIKQTDWTYALMIHFSQSLGVNCTYCHNSRQFAAWDQSTPQRTNAWYGIRMVRDLNQNYLASLQNVFPPARLGPLGDTAKVNCATCHQGVYKPLFGASMVQTYPELGAQKQ